MNALFKLLGAAAAVAAGGAAVAMLSKLADKSSPVHVEDTEFPERAEIDPQEAQEISQAYAEGAAAADDGEQPPQPAGQEPAAPQDTVVEKMSDFVAAATVTVQDTMGPVVQAAAPVVKAAAGAAAGAMTGAKAAAADFAGKVRTKAAAMRSANEAAQEAEAEEVAEAAEQAAPAEPAAEQAAPAAAAPAAGEDVNPNPVMAGPAVAPKDADGKFDPTQIAKQEDFGDWEDQGCQG